MLVRAGDISFSIYAVHPIVTTWLDAHLIPSTFNEVDCLILILVGIWVTAEFTYCCVEMPFMRLGTAVCRQIDELTKRLEFRLEEDYHQVPSDDLEADVLEVDNRNPEFHVGTTPVPALT